MQNMRSCPIFLSLAQEVDDDEMKDDVSKDKIRESTFSWYWTKLYFVCRIYLKKHIIQIH